MLVISEVTIDLSPKIIEFSFFYGVGDSNLKRDLVSHQNMMQICRCIFKASLLMHRWIERERVGEMAHE